MFASEIREMTEREIDQKIEDMQQELFNLRFQQASGQLKDYSRLTVVKREIARLKTIARQKQLAR